MKTAFLAAPGATVWRDHGKIAVPRGHWGAFCESCCWHSVAPTREREAELLRVCHALSAHGPEIQAGEFTVHLAEYVQSDGRLRFSPLSEAV